MGRTMSPSDHEEPETGDAGEKAEGSDSPKNPSRLREIWENPAYRFVLLFLPLLGVVSLVYPLFVKHFNFVIQAFIEATATIEYYFLSVFSSEARLNGKLVWFGNFVVKIIDECTGIYEMLIFSAAVLAFPTGWRDKGLGILMGCPMIYLFNLLRIAMLIVVGRFWPSAFDFMHVYFWQATMIVMITTVWLIWITKVVRRDETAPAHPA